MSWDGLLLIDKPKDWTSHDVVAKVRRLLSLSAVGHSGTLDPFASGLLVLLLGQGTKVSDFILSQDKSYEVELRLGVETDTLDRTGQILKQDQVQLSPEKIQAAVQKCQGEVELDVPLFSAVKIKGKKLYDYARSGKEVERPKKKMHFYNIEVLEIGSDFLKARLSCSKGSYIRAWADWVGKELEVGATTQELRRCASQPFYVEAATSIGDLEAMIMNKREAPGEIQKDLAQAFVPLAQALPDMRGLTISSRDERLLLNGQISREIGSRLISEQKEAIRRNEILPIKVISNVSGRLLAVLEAHPDKGLKIRRIFKPKDLT